MKKFLYKNIPNFITSMRVIGAIAIIFLKPFSLEFFIVYGACGVTDAFDGFIARKLHLVSKFGTIFDSVCDLLFLGVMGIKILPTMIELLPWWNWVMILGPTALHLIAYIVCLIKFHKFSAIHTYANKVLSAAIFLYPFTFIGYIAWIYETYVMVFGVVAFFSSIETNLIHLLAHRYDTRNKSVFLVKKNEQNPPLETQKTAE